MKRRLSLFLCAALLLVCGCTYGAAEQVSSGKEYDLYV